MSEEDKKLQKHLVNEMMKVYETNPDVMLYMQSLMENYEKLEQENKQLEEHCEVMLRIFEKMSEEQKQEQLGKYITELRQKNKKLKQILYDIEKEYDEKSLFAEDSILTELEEWLKEEQERYRDYLSTSPENDSEYNSKYATQCGLAQVDIILDKIQKLKEKYK